MSSTIEILLLQDVPGLGQFGQKRRVKAGYARNYLLPEALAMVSNKANEALFAITQKKELARRASEKQAAVTLAASLKDLKLSFTAKAHDEGKLYGSISTTDILDAIQKEKEITLEKKQILLDEPFKTVGQFDVTIHLHFDVQVVISVEIVAEKA